MILAFDTWYDTGGKAKTVCLAFERWEDEQALAIHTAYMENVADYTPGEFYKRELPCILELFATLPYEGIEAIVVDGFVFLNDEGKLGLGGHLYEALEKKIPVIGVAKTNFASLEQNKIALLRGESLKPLYVTATGIDPQRAAQQVKRMAGEYRFPALLKQLDQLTKEWNADDAD